MDQIKKCVSYREDDKPLCNCAIFGIFNHPQASLMTYYALHSLQHRGQEASGITSFYYDRDKEKMRYAYTRGEGLVLDVFSDPKILTKVLKGTSAIGHNRYSTTGSSNRANIQPFNMQYHNGIISIAHNGNLTNTRELREKLHKEGAIFQTTTDTELILHLIARSKKETKIEQIRDALRQTKGAYSLVLLTEDALICARDPHGVRPLSIGIANVDGRNSYAVASESCAFDMINAEYVRSVGHNEIIVIDNETVETGNMKTYTIEEKTPTSHHCIFEYIYFSRPDSKIFGHNVDKVRRRLGKALAEESPVIKEGNEKVTCIAVPDSGNTATLGYAKVNQEKCPTRYELGLIRSHYVGRTFIAPGQDNREFKVKVKFNPVRGVLENRPVVVIDDSIVRGTTSKSLIKLIRQAGAKEVHMRITSPPIKFPCFYGMDFPSREELIANHHKGQKEIGEAINVDSLHYLSKEKLLESVPKDKGVGYCTACFDGDYPIQIDKNQDKYSAEL
jgi:amidophosphoribosyltransferase